MVRRTAYEHEIRAIFEAKALVFDNERGHEPKEEVLLVLRILQHSSCLTSQRGKFYTKRNVPMRKLQAYIPFESDTALSSHGASIIAAL